MDTLVLTVGYEPHDKLSWKQAFNLLLCEHGRFAPSCPRGCTCGSAEVIEAYGRVHTVNADFPIPAVVRLLAAVPRKKQGLRFNRENLVARDGGRCQYCGAKVPRPEMTLDHVVPRAQGGPTRWENIVLACFRCNQRKANRTPDQAAMRLLRPPRRPTRVENARVLLTFRPGMPKQWRDWLRTMDYWHAELESDEP